MNNWKSFSTEQPQAGSLFIAYCDTPGMEGSMLCNTMVKRNKTTLVYHKDNGIMPCLENPTHWHPFTPPSKTQDK